MLNKITLISLVFTLFLGAGCGTANKSGFLSGYQQLHQGRYVEKYWSDAALTKQTVSKIFIEPIDTSRIKDQPTVTVSDASRWLQTAINSSIKTNQSWEIEARPEQSTAKLALAITFLTPGSAGGRIFAGELGMGHAIVQVEGKLIDSNSGKEMALFADRRRDSGTIGIEDTTGDAGPKLVRGMLEKIGSHAVKEISESAK
jgi:hypothetical protein